MTTTLRQLRSDVAQRPELFVWYGPYEASLLDEWLGARELDVPPDLRELWLSFGAGDAFETEEFLAPFDGPEYAADFAASNEAHRSEGLPEGLFVFHDGVCLSAVRRSEPRFVVLDRNSWAIKQAFASLDAWYCGTLRREYAQRYGLKPLQA
jgi:hypothetical protein